MAKKKAKRAARPARRKAVRAKKVARRKPSRAGAGPTTREIGTAVAAHVNAGRPDKEIWDRFWSPKIVSVEGTGATARGRRALEAKSREWYKLHRLHGVAADGPWSGPGAFAIRFRVDAEVIATGERMQMEEIALYTVKNGKVVREEFMY